jgi:predicted DCC family thiol-disulfide oxidoreductase YuxK
MIRRMKTPDQTLATVYFDGGCPVCSREIAVYQSQAGADAVSWVDVSRCDASQLGPDLSRADAMARLHLRRADGSLVSGAEAFTSLWRVLPRWSWLGRLLGTAPALVVLEAMYRMFLVVRRSWRRA